MCRDCGCEPGNQKIFNQIFEKQGHAPHGHFHDGHYHEHSHPGHDHTDMLHGVEPSRTIELGTRVLEKNDVLASKNREFLQKRNVFAVNLISSPGSGKTFLLEKTLEGLRTRCHSAVLTGDQQTDNDARRLMGKGAPVAQIQTFSSCHLDAERVAPFLEQIVSEDTQILFIENVGNLVCPAAFDLGEHFKIALLSVTEGEDKPLKYPVLFADSPVVVITKTDLVPYLEWDMALCKKNIRKIRPDVKIFELSAKTGEGMINWLNYLMELVG